MSEHAPLCDITVMMEMMTLFQKNQRPHNQMSDNIMKIAVTICTAGILWLVTSVSALQNQMTAITIKHSVTEKSLARLDDYTQEPRFTAEDFHSYLEPIKQKVDRHNDILSARQSWEDSSNQRLTRLEGNYAVVIEKLSDIANDISEAQQR
jgi:predicted P-loop ATPase/GTPase